MKPIRVLVIDDEQIVLDSITKVLSGKEYEIDVTQNSRQGLEWAVQNPYDIVLTDIRMPDIGGMRILRDVKRARPAVPVVIITGYATIQSAVQAMKLGAADYLEKPFTPDELIRAVTSALDVASARPPEDQSLVHKEEVIRVLERAASDTEFVGRLFSDGAGALEAYQLSGPEKLALLTGDIVWIEKHVGPLTKEQRRWLEQRLTAEIW